MLVGIQFSGTVGANATKRWYTWNWRTDRQIVWTVVPTSPNAGAAQIEWDVAVQRSAANALTYWITIRNLTAADVTIEARYGMLP
jgi:hypothetical protein